ncbi:hypothetical protein Zmor_021501 [Zophobas morio]|uniref:Uncharacterized protein n=1 Tax=Zophobas morio TaxID=2755281 RepID=A0AA38MB00_9CUCU|nr:hypothetical protein Zmor_021501 [Zophobas morio]
MQSTSANRRRPAKTLHSEPGTQESAKTYENFHCNPHCTAPTLPLDDLPRCRSGGRRRSTPHWLTVADRCLCGVAVRSRFIVQEVDTKKIERTTDRPEVNSCEAARRNFK